MRVKIDEISIKIMKHFSSERRMNIVLRMWYA
jgi:hypothetical protein